MSFFVRNWRHFFVSYSSKNVYFFKNFSPPEEAFSCALFGGLCYAKGPGVKPGPLRYDYLFTDLPRPPSFLPSAGLW